MPIDQAAKALRGLAEAGDELARCVFRQQAMALGRLFTIAANVIDPDAYFLGGGVVGDLAGFVAATYLRGVPFVQVPTTLLAQVDSSVGGKVGVNLKSGKNLVGAFHQPRLVLCDLDSLGTLPLRELRAGIAEIIKYGIIYDARLFQLLEQRLDALMAKVLVYARGLNSFPSWSVRAKTGMKDTIVFETAVTIAVPTSQAPSS